jgi:hypothetical protein
MRVNNAIMFLCLLMLLMRSQAAASSCKASSYGKTGSRDRSPQGIPEDVPGGRTIRSTFKFMGNDIPTRVSLPEFETLEMIARKMKELKVEMKDEMKELHAEMKEEIMKNLKVEMKEFGKEVVAAFEAYISMWALLYFCVYYFVKVLF